MDAILALIVAGAVFRTDGTWAITRLVSLLMVPFGILADFLPSAPALQPVRGWAWLAVGVLWLTNVLIRRRVRAS